jgi:hypothetical protein
MAYPALPHFAAPFAWDTNGIAQVVPQDDPREVLACVYNIAVCSVGYRTDDPTFGIDTLAFASAPLKVATVLGEIRAQEPRASVTAVESMIGPATRKVAIAVRAPAQGAS